MKCQCLMCLAEGDNSPHVRRLRAVKVEPDNPPDLPDEWRDECDDPSREDDEEGD